MCGIFGIINTNNKKVKDGDLRLGRDKMIHRGPDSAGLFIEDNVGLAFRRLSLVDLSSSGNQPMSNEDGSVWLVFNGEFYNYKKYRKDLIARGHIFKSKTDSEVIIHLYEEYGHKFLSKVDGMFALAIYDSKKNRLLLARDRFGQKPLYYGRTKSSFLFSSELKSIITQKGFVKNLSKSSLMDYFSFGYVLAPHSIFENISKVQPSHYLVIDTNKGTIIEKNNYWNFKKIFYKKAAIDTDTDFMSLFKESVRVRAFADVPVGVFLSGGIDSTVITAIMSEFSSNPVKTFSMKFDENDFDESRYSREVAKRFNTEHHEFNIAPNSIELLPELVNYFDEPFDDSSALPTFFLSKMTSNHVKAVLGGDGADELLAGYRRYGDFIKMNSMLGWIPLVFRKPFFRATHYIYPKDRRGSRRLYMAGVSTEEAYQEFMKTNNTISIEQLLNKNYFENGNINFKNITNKNLDLISQMQSIDATTYLPGDILTKVDRASMAHSLEVRSPFLDHGLWEHAFLRQLPKDI